MAELRGCLPSHGRSQIDAFFASRVPVSIRAGAETGIVYLDQTKTAPINSLLMPLGTFQLAAGEEVIVEVSNAGTEGYVVADCLQLVKK